MRAEPLISVIMPAYNAGRYIGESINSVIKQTYEHWELIIVDDGSTDDTALVINVYAKVEKRIKYIYQKNGRQGKARNLAIENSNGDYLAFLDADDMWCDDKLLVQVDILKARPEIDLICSQGYWLHADGCTEQFCTTIKEWDWDNDSEAFISLNRVAILSAIVKKSAVVAVGLFTEKSGIQNAEDYHLWLKLLHNRCRFLSIPDFLFYYRIHEGQSTYNNDEAINLLNCYLDLLENKIINRDSKALKNRIKWMIFQSPCIDHILKQMKQIFPAKKLQLNLFIQLNKWFPNRLLLKKIAFHSL